MRFKVCVVFDSLDGKCTYMQKGIKFIYIYRINFFVNLLMPQAISRILKNGDLRVKGINIKSYTLSLLDAVDILTVMDSITPKARASKRNSSLISKVIRYFFWFINTIYFILLVILYVQEVVTLQKKILNIFASENEIYTIL